MKNLGERLKLFRKSLDLTQTKFAEPLKITGGNISSIEKGKSFPSEAVFQLMKIHYRINRKWLETGAGEMLVKPEPTTAEPEKPYRQGGDKITTEFLTVSADVFRIISNAQVVLESNTPIAEKMEEAIDKYYSEYVAEKKKKKSGSAEEDVHRFDI